LKRQFEDFENENRAQTKRKCGDFGFNWHTRIAQQLEAEFGVEGVAPNFRNAA
jgi:hypothetical protein